jgi:hypothetical protein
MKLHLKYLYIGDQIHINKMRKYIVFTTFNVYFQKINLFDTYRGKVSLCLDALANYLTRRVSSRSIAVFCEGERAIC